MKLDMSKWKALSIKKSFKERLQTDYICSIGIGGLSRVFL